MPGRSLPCSADDLSTRTAAVAASPFWPVVRSRFEARLPWHPVIEDYGRFALPIVRPFAAWYWHFVDVVWIFLFACIYVWGAGAAGAMHAAGH